MTTTTDTVAVTASNGHEPCVLIVDDQDASLDALEATLASTGCGLIRAQSADEALLALLDRQVAAIVLDVRMPGLDGYALARLIKLRRRTEHVPILFLTAHLPDNEDILRGYASGAVDYLTKPIHPAVLRSKVGVFLELFRKTRELAQANEALRAEVEARTRAEEELRKANEELEQRVLERTAALREADRRKDEFLANLSHELRTPLNAIYGWARMLRTEQIGLAAVPKAVEVIERNARIQTQLISDLLDLSRIVAGTLHLRFELVDLARVIREAAESMKTVAEGRSIELETDCRSDGLVPGDADRLRQVVWNLLSNGIKFSESGGHVQVSLDGEAGMAVLTVRDDGCGIRPELLPVIFERFRQGDNSPTRAQSGLGIGLTIVKHLVEAHGGTVTAASAGEGRGSLFTVRLPARRADEMATAS